MMSDEIQLSEALAGPAAAKCADLSPEELASLNPAVDRAVFRGAGHIPRGYRLRVPPGSAGAFQQRLAQIAADARVVAVAPSRNRRESGKAGAVRVATRGRYASTERIAASRMRGGVLYAGMTRLIVGR